MAFLLRKGYRVIPVNPGHAGVRFSDQPVVARLADIGEAIDMVRRPSVRLRALPRSVDEILSAAGPPQGIWGQLSVRDDALRPRPEAAASGRHGPLPRNRISATDRLIVNK